MTKKILQLLVVLLFTAQGVMGQTVSVVSLSNAAPGDIEVQVDMDDFTDVGSITLEIEVDSGLLVFQGITETTLDGSWVANYDESTNRILIAWFAPNNLYYNSPSGKLFKLQFYNKGGFSSDVTFDETGCEIGDLTANTIEPVTYTNGTVTQGASVGTVTMGSVTNVSQGDIVNLPINFEGTGFGTVNGFTLRVFYDDAALLYTGIDNNTLTGVVANANNGIITISWNSATAEDFTSSTDVFDLQFTYNGVGSELVSFQPGSEVMSSGSPLATDYTNGLITPEVNIWSATIVDAAAPSDSADVTQTIRIDGFGTSVNSLGAITLKISYDESLTYKSFSAVQGSGWVVNNTANNEITFSISGTIPVSSGPLLTIDWTYYNQGGGDADVVFMPGCEFADLGLNLGPIIYNDGYVGLYSDVNAKVFLQGAYNSGSMNTTINGYLPTTQPYSGSPWNYAGTETVTSMPTDVVDWVLVELRTGTAAATIVDTRAGLLLSDGSIVDTDGSSLLRFSGLEAGNYYIVVKHRYHLAIMSAAAQTIEGSSALYDFTSSMTQTYNPDTGIDPLQDLGDGNWGLYSGDGNADGAVDLNDVFYIYFPESGSVTGYYSGDWYIDSNVDLNDIFYIYFITTGQATQVPN